MAPGWWCVPSVQHKTPAKKNKSSDNRESERCWTVYQFIPSRLSVTLVLLRQGLDFFPDFQVLGLTADVRGQLAVCSSGASRMQFEHVWALWKFEEWTLQNMISSCVLLDSHTAHVLHCFTALLPCLLPAAGVRTVRTWQPKHVKAKVFGSAARRIAEGSSARRFAQFRRTYKTLTYSLILFDNLCILYHTDL